MHVAMVTDFYWPLLGGVEQHVRTVAHELARRGHRVTVITTQTGESPERELDGAVDVRRIRTGVQRLPVFDQQRPWAPPIPDPVATWQIRRLVRDLRPDVVHGHDWLARSALLADRGVPFVSTQHYYTLTCAKKNLLRDGRPCPGPEPAACWRCARAHYGTAKGAVTLAGTALGARLERRRASTQISVSTATALGNRLPVDEHDSVVIPNCLSALEPLTAEHRALLEAFPEGQPFLYVGDFREVKGVDVLLEAYAASEVDRPLVLIGKRWPESPSTYPRGVVTFENWPNPAVRAAMARARALVVPSVWVEPFGIVAIEAMSAGAPVIASATGGLVDIVDHDVTGLLVEPASPAALATAMQRLDADDELRNAMGGAGLRAAERYSAERVVDEIVAVYERAVASRRRA